MTSIFNYKTLNVTLETKNRSIQVELTKSAIDFETLFELETLFTWAAAHLEINSILLTGSKHTFSSGIDREKLIKMKDEKLQQFFSKMQKLIYTMFFLPQTIIVDLKDGAHNIASELSVGADIRIISQDGFLSFDHLQNGFVPTCGGIGFLSAIIGNAIAKNWVLTGTPISSKTLLSAGFVQEAYDSDRLSIRNKYLQLIANQAPIARIQTKRSFLEPILKKLDHTIEFEKEFAWAGMATRDWERGIQGTPFTPARDLAKKLKAERKFATTTP